VTYHDGPHPLSDIEPPAGLTDSTRRSLIPHSGLQFTVGGRGFRELILMASAPHFAARRTLARI
jgi:hypothetical protein